LDNFEAKQRVEIGQRLVHQDHVRLHRQRPRNRHALPLAARQFAGIALEQLLNMHQAGGSVHASIDFCLWQLLHAHAERNVLEYRQMREHRIVLEHHRDTPRSWRELIDATTADPYLALRGRLQARDDAQQRRLAAAGRAEQDHELAVGDRETD